MLRLHEIGQIALEAFGQIGARRLVAAAAHHQMHRLAQTRIRHAQRHRLGNEAGGERGLLDFLRGYAVTRALDHRVAPSGKIEQAFSRAPHTVARPDRHPAIA